MATWDITSAPLDETKLDTIAPVLRVLGGAALIAYSGTTTVIILGGLLSAVIKGEIAGLGMAYLVAGVLAFLVTIGQWATRRKAQKAHWFLVLFCDAPFTTWQTAAWLTIIAQAQTTVELAGQIVIWVAALAWGIFCAKAGEALLVRKAKG